MKPKKTNSRKPIALKYGCIVADPPWAFSDKLTMSDVKRGAASQYPTLNIAALIEMGFRIQTLTAENAVLALWVPSALLVDGLRVMQAWGFEHKAIYTWGKTGKGEEQTDPETAGLYGKEAPKLAFGMGRYFRGCTEHALIGSRGKGAALIQSKSERNLELHEALRHSAKPEGLQDRLERMLPDENKLELFARRARKGWLCVGNECPGFEGVDIRTWLEEVAPLPVKAKAS